MIENIYYMVFSVLPTKQNQEYDNIESATVYCWIKSTDVQSSYIKATFFIEKADWIIQENTQEPIIVIEENFTDREIGLENFHKAQKEKMSFLYFVESDNVTEPTKVELQSSYKFDMSKFLQKFNDISKEGRCLHYHTGDRCNEIINAHSIQNNGVLSKIANEKNEIYALSRNMGDFKKNDGNIGFRRYPISKFSIFRGFCKNHDDELFKPIDTLPFKSGNQQQVFLYAYRSLAKELFDKENALNMHIQTLEDVKDNKGLSKYILALIDGSKNALNSLNKHKKTYDNVLESEMYSDMRYVSFNSTDKLFMAFSNIMYPDYDFMGNLIQDLSNTNTENRFDLITFCSAPTEDGWSFIFSWHKNSDTSCLPFIQSLKDRMKQGDDLGTILFKFILLNSENFALSPIWWESISTDKQKEISQAITNMMQPT
ncbi:MAG: hypothetical protein K0U47_09415, partial [Epsilonproteobacteria bacterium]|nr:hypothetical protein [Campylobacterota bacterium]